MTTLIIMDLNFNVINWLNVYDVIDENRYFNAKCKSKKVLAFSELPKNIYMVTKLSPIKLDPNNSNSHKHNNSNNWINCYSINRLTRQKISLAKGWVNIHHYYDTRVMSRNSVVTVKTG